MLSSFYKRWMYSIYIIYLHISEGFTKKATGFKNIGIVKVKLHLLMIGFQMHIRLVIGYKALPQFLIVHTKISTHLHKIVLHLIIQKLDHSLMKSYSTFDLSLTEGYTILCKSFTTAHDCATFFEQH